MANDFQWAEDVVAHGLAGLKRLNGYYHDNFVAEHNGRKYLIRVKKPHADQMDYRTIDETPVLQFLKKHGYPAPACYAENKAHNFVVHEFIEGMTLSELYPRHKQMSRGVIDDLSKVVARLHKLPIGELIPHVSDVKGNNREFFADLIKYVERIYNELWSQRPDIYDELGFPAKPTSILYEMAIGITERAMVLCHTDLHQHNVRIRSGDEALVLVDWELAAIGDPAYDLANTINRMNFNESDEDAFLNKYFALMGNTNSKPLRDDVERYLALEHIQTVIVNGFRLSESKQHPSDDVAANYERNERFPRIMKRVREIWKNPTATA